jgi:predicted DNA binding protein
MKKNIISLILILCMAISAVALIRISIKETQEFNNDKAKQGINEIKSTNVNVSKNLIKYNNIIHLVNKYNGQIKEFKNNASLINADIIVNGNEEKLSNFVGELRKIPGIHNISSMCLNNQSNDKEDYSLEVDVEFNKTSENK